MVAIFVAACGGDDTAAVDAAAAGDAHAVDARDLDAMQGCNSLEQTAGLIEQIAVPEDPPGPLGGAFPDGRYHMIADTLYTGAGGASGATGQHHRTTTSCEDLVCQLRAFSSNLGDLPASTVVFEPDGSSLVLRQVCPGPEVAVSMTYTTVTDGSGTAVTLYEPFQGRIAGRVYQLQP
jgi:hypothetical protein